jgi:hypothetical protein
VQVNRHWEMFRQSFCKPDTPASSIGSNYYTFDI